MYINPRTAIERGWIKLPEFAMVDPEKYIQPNALDWTIDTAMEMESGIEELAIYEDSKMMPTWRAIARTGREESPSEIILQTGRVYDVTSDFYVDLPEGVCATLTIRSSFSRCGVRLSSGIFDSGYQGHIGCGIINYGPDLRTAYRTRIAQIAFFASDSAKQYAGGWNAEEGKHWSDLGRTS